MDAWIDQKVKAGMYASSSELIREGLRLLQFRDEQRAKMSEDLRNELLVGIKQLDAGKSQTFDQALIDNVKRDARKMFAP